MLDVFHSQQILQMDAVILNNASVGSISKIHLYRICRCVHMVHHPTRRDLVQDLPLLHREDDHHVTSLCLVIIDNALLLHELLQQDTKHGTNITIVHLNLGLCSG